MREEERSPAEEAAADDRDTEPRGWFDPVSGPRASVMSTGPGQDESGTPATRPSRVTSDAVVVIPPTPPDRVIDETNVDVPALVAVAPPSVSGPVSGGTGSAAPDSLAASPGVEVTDDAASQPTTDSPEADRPPGAPSAAPDGQDRQAVGEPAHRARAWLRPGRPARPVEPTKVTVSQTISEPGTDRKPKAKRSRAAFFGVPPASRPDVLTDAETVMFPQFRGDAVTTDRGSARATATDGGAVSEAKAAAPSSIALADEPTQILSAVALRAGLAPSPIRNQPKPAAPRPERYVASQHVKRMSHLVLIALLCVQAILSLRLRNTAFEDEAQYLYAGHMEFQHLLHGTPLKIDFTSYFSGSPVLYPVLAAALDQVGGLALARALSLVEMLAITTMVYSIARYLFNERIGLYSAALFAVAESTLFLGNFATFDATCLFLLAFAAWIMVYTARCRWPLFLLAAPVAATAAATKYAGLIFVPTIAVLPVLTAWPYRIRRVWFYPVVFAIAVAGLLYGGLRLGGHDYIAALQSTTTNRALGATPPLVILREFLEWGGVVFAVAAFGSVAYMRRVHTEPDEDIAPAGSRLRRAVVGAVLTGTVLLAPAYQAHLHTDTSFWKHVGFGLFFAAPMAGFGFARLVGDFVRRPYFGVAVWSLALMLGMMQSGNLYHAWPDSKPFVTAFSAYLEPNARYLVELPEVPTYYLMGNPDAQPEQFYSTFAMTFDNAKGETEHGDQAFALAVIAGYFHVIAYCNAATPAAAGTLQSVLQQTSYYRLAKVVELSSGVGPINYYIWVRAPGTMTYLTPASKTGQPNRFTKFG